MFLDEAKINWKSFKPQNFYKLNKNDKSYVRTVREQIMHRNEHFFDKPEDLLRKQNEMYKKHGIPDMENIRRFREKKDPYLIKNFDSLEEEKLYRYYYLG